MYGCGHNENCCSSTESKSRINFLSLLSQGIDAHYVINEGALDYMARQKLPLTVLALLEDKKETTIDTPTDWEAWLDSQLINRPHHRKIITEGALIGGLLARGIPVDLSVISDDAGQFNVFDHALCWIHAERIINRLIPLNDHQSKAVDSVREQIWSLYRDLKHYKLNPLP